MYEAMGSAPASSGLSPATRQEYEGKLSECIQAALRLGCPIGSETPGVQPGRDAAAATEGDYEEEEDLDEGQGQQKDGGHGGEL